MTTDNIQDLYELTPAQHGMLFHTLIAPNSGIYFSQINCTLNGALNLAAFKEAWQRVINRHPVFRTSIHWEDTDKPIQMVSRQVEAPLEVLNWRDTPAQERESLLSAFVKADRERGFELTDAPLMRLVLIRLTEDAYQFIWSYHHMLLDGWSLPIVLREVLTYYDALSRGADLDVDMETPRPFGDYIAWLQNQDLSRAEQWWKALLKGFKSPTPLGIDQSAYDLPGYDLEDYGKQTFWLTEETTTALQSLARQHQITLNTVMQAAWALLLSRYSGETDVVYGAVVSGRPASLSGVEEMVGMFINTLPVRVQIDESEHLIAWFKRMQAQQADMSEFEYSPLPSVKTWSEIALEEPLFESVFVFENYPVDDTFQQQESALKTTGVQSFQRTNYPLTLVAMPGKQVAIEALYDRGRFERAAIERMLNHLGILLDGVAANADRPIAGLDLLSASERDLLMSWNDTRVDFNRSQFIHEMFQLQVERSPYHPAVICGDRSISYIDLNRKSNQVSRFMRSIGTTRDSVVGICLNRSIELVIGLMAILKAGAAYLPIDPEYPPDRVSFMLEDSGVELIASEVGLEDLLRDFSGVRFCLDDDWKVEAWEAIASQKQGNFNEPITPDNLAYVIYTSGSTGKPKAAMNTHSAIANRLLWMQQQYNLTPDDRILQKTPMSFDVSVWEFFWPLISGATLVMAKPGGHRDTAYLKEVIVQNEVSVLHFVPSMLQAFLQEEGLDECRSVRAVISSGEALSRDLVEKFYARMPGELHNLYGPTETAVDVTYWKCEAEGERGVVPIGRPIANSQIYVLDRQMGLMPVGVVGEVYIGGVGVGRGYMQRPELTAERYVPNPYGRKEGERLYRSGDLGRYRPDGSIEYVGRKDDQVKIRGFRVELGEIETVLAQHPGILEAVVLAKQEGEGSKYLEAYLAAHAAPPPSVSELHDFLKTRLPDFMIPASFIMMNALPHLPNGKIDRKSLSAFAGDGLQLKELYVAPRTPVEEALVAIWKQALGVEGIGIDDNFFLLKGDSIRAIQVVGRAREAGLNVTVQQLIEHPTVRTLAECIAAAEAPPPESVGVETFSLISEKDRARLQMLASQGSGDNEEV